MKSPSALVKKVFEAIAVMFGHSKEEWNKPLQGHLYAYI